VSTEKEHEALVLDFGLPWSLSITRSPVVFSSELALPEGQFVGQLVKNATDTALVEAGTLRNLGQRQPLPLQFEQLMMLARTQVKHLLPQIVGLGFFARTGNRGFNALPRERLFPGERASVLTIAIDESMARRGDQEAAQLVRILERPGSILERCKTSAQTDCTMSAESNFARSGWESCRRTTRRKVGS
jgi:hypothetical protein